MKAPIISLFILLAGIFTSCIAPGIKLSHDFDRGSLGEMVEEEPGYFMGSTRHWMKRDSVGDQYYWFYMKADHVRDMEVTFKLNNLAGVYRGTPHIVYTDYTLPVYSYDQENWERIRNVKYDSASQTFQFSEYFEKEPVWIAYAHPYPFLRLKSLIGRIASSEFVQIENLAKTREFRDISLVKITDSRVPDDGKTTVMILALQHAGEDAGAFMAEGMIDFLISDDPEAKRARERFNYLIVPMMNPDGTFNGTSRYNMEMEDLNNIWLDKENAQPEVTGLKMWVEAWYADGNDIDLFMDIHNHTQFHRYNVLVLQDHSLDSLAAIMDRQWPVRSWQSEFRGSSCAYFFRKGIPSMTVELSQSHPGDGNYLEIDDYHSYGKKTVVALSEYY